MRTHRRFATFTAFVLCLGVLPVLAADSEPTPPPDSGVQERGIVPVSPDFFIKREQAAPPAIRQQLNEVRQLIQSRRLNFRVGFTTAMERTFEQLTGDIIPSNTPQIARQRNAMAEQLQRIDAEERDKFLKLNPGKLREILIPLVPCAQRRQFDWRTGGIVSPVKDQGGCGSCWSFAVIGALESSWAKRNGPVTDESEQYVLANSGAGNCAGGNRADANAFLVSTGTSTEATVPYTGMNGPPNPGAPTPYDAVATGFVDAAVEIPTVQKIKEAICQYGPVTVSVFASSNAFKGYIGGVYEEFINGPKNPDGTLKTGHAVVLVGWDDDKGAWLMKNSWGIGWGESGYMWIKYNSNNVGRWAQWIQAKNAAYRLPPGYFQILKNAGLKLKIAPQQ